MLIDGQFRVAAPPARVLALLFDARLMAECLPGCEALEALDADRYRAVVVVALAGVKARFDLLVEVTARDADGVRALTRGEEGGNASTLQATSEVRLAPDADGTRIDYRSEVAVTGRLGRFALGMMKKKAQSLGDEFASNLQARLNDGAAAPVAASPAAATASAPVTSRTSEATDVRATEPVAVRTPEPVSAWHRLVHWLRRALGLEPRTSVPPPAASGPRPRH
jgi:carbon monoxide dehydrogenase subunit G